MILYFALSGCISEPPRMIRLPVINEERMIDNYESKPLESLFSEAVIYDIPDDLDYEFRFISDDEKAIGSISHIVKSGENSLHSDEQLFYLDLNTGEYKIVFDIKDTPDYRENSIYEIVGHYIDNRNLVFITYDYDGGDFYIYYMDMADQSIIKIHEEKHMFPNNAGIRADSDGKGVMFSVYNTSKDYISELYYLDFKTKDVTKVCEHEGYMPVYTNGNWYCLTYDKKTEEITIGQIEGDTVHKYKIMNTLGKLNSITRLDDESLLAVYIEDLDGRSISRPYIINMKDYSTKYLFTLKNHFMEYPRIKYPYILWAGRDLHNEDGYIMDYVFDLNTNTLYDPELMTPHTYISKNGIAYEQYNNLIIDPEYTSSAKGRKIKYTRWNE